MWISFFREHFAAFVFILVLLPTALFFNWRLALPLVVLCVVFTVLTAVVMQQAQALQRAVERHYTDLAETAADTLGNIAVVQSFARVEVEVSALRVSVNSLLARADAGADVVGRGRGAHAHRHHHHHARDLPRRHSISS